MLTALIESSNQKIIAGCAEKTSKPFACPCCKNEVILKQGAIKIAHFAHKPPVLCEYGQGESELHRQCKNEIYQSLLGLDGLHCELEKFMGTVRPDIYVKTHTGEEFAIEVQISTLTMDKIIYRTKQYNRLGVHVLWLPVFDELEPYPNLRHSPSAWERWLHSLYFGRVYYWLKGLKIQPVHFNDYYLYVEATDWGGGYYKKSKRYKMPINGDALNFPSDFRVKNRSPFEGGDIVIPESKILIDNHCFSFWPTSVNPNLEREKERESMRW
jgi:competence protein CoiA